jgi:hypothetical protein
MMTLSKTYVAPVLRRLVSLRLVALGLVALTGVVAAVPASARPYEGRDGWSHERGYDQGYRYHRDWREMRHHDRVIEWRDGYYRR